MRKNRSRSDFFLLFCHFCCKIFKKCVLNLKYMNKNTSFSFIFLFLGGILLISTAFSLSSQNKRLLTASLYTPPQCPFHLGLTPNQVKTNSELSLKQEAILLKLFFTHAVLDSRGVAICKETDTLNTCLARFQNFCYQQGKCEEQYDGSKDAIITSDMQISLCLIWNQRYIKLFDSWTKVTSLFTQKNTSVPSWLTSARNSYLIFKNQQTTTTTTTTTISTTTITTSSGNSNLNITFPKVLQPTIFVYPDPDIIKKVVPPGYEYYPTIEQAILGRAPQYQEIPYGYSRQFRAAIVYPDGKYITSLEDKVRFEFKADWDQYFMPPLSLCITGFDYQLKPNSKPKIVNWIYEQITGWGIIREAHEDIVSPELQDAAKILNKSNLLF